NPSNPRAFGCGRTSSSGRCLVRSCAWSGRFAGFARSSTGLCRPVHTPPGPNSSAHGRILAAVWICSGKISEKFSDSVMEVTETARVVVRPSPIHGKGAFARTDIPAGIRVLEYIGERITKKESLRRCQGNNEYIFSLD